MKNASNPETLAAFALGDWCDVRREIAEAGRVPLKVWLQLHARKRRAKGRMIKAGNALLNSGILPSASKTKDSASSKTR